MSIIIKCICCLALIASICPYLVGQITTADGETPTNLSRPSQLFNSEMEIVLLEIYDSEELDRLNAEIEQLLEQRERLMFRLAREKYPHLSTKLLQRETVEKNRQTQRKAEQARLKEERKREREKSNPPNGGRG